MMKLFAAGLFMAAVVSTPVAASDIPKFGKNCVPDYKESSSICLTSNGKVISSTYMFRGKFRTRGTHSGCSLKGSSISCSGGTWRTSQGTGKMNPVVVKLSKDKPVSIRWR